MDKKNIQSILQDALEEQIPSPEVDLWRTVKSSLVAGNFKQQGAKMNTTRPRRLSRLAYVSLTVIALLALAFTTPQGRALAQEVLQLFKRAERLEYPLPTEMVISPEEAQAMPTAMPPAPLVSVAEAEKAAGFDAKELPSTPQGFVFVGAMAGAGGISIQYEVASGGGALVLNESTHGFMQSEMDQAPAEAISQVKVGGVEAEIVQGTFVVYAGDTHARWNPDAPILRLRWIEDGIWFELAKFGGVEAVEYLDQTALIALAESLK